MVIYSGFYWIVQISMNFKQVVPTKKILDVKGPGRKKDMDRKWLQCLVWNHPQDGLQYFIFQFFGIVRVDCPTWRSLKSFGWSNQWTSFSSEMSSTAARPFHVKPVPVSRRQAPVSRHRKTAGTKSGPQVTACRSRVVKPIIDLLYQKRGMVKVSPNWFAILGMVYGIGFQKQPWSGARNHSHRCISSWLGHPETSQKKGRDICDRTAFAWLMGISCHHCWIHTLLIGETQAVSLRSAGPSGGLGHFLFFHSVGSNHPNWLSVHDFSDGLIPQPWTSWYFICGMVKRWMMYPWGIVIHSWGFIYQFCPMGWMT